MSDGHRAGLCRSKLKGSGPFGDSAEFADETGSVSGNGVVGGAAACVLGLIAMALGGLALARSRRVSSG